MNLAQLPLNRTARVVGVDLPADGSVRFRLRELGLRDGAQLRVTHKAAFGGRVVALGADRLAVDARTCAHVEVRPDA